MSARHGASQHSVGNSWCSPRYVLVGLVFGLSLFSVTLFATTLHGHDSRSMATIINIIGNLKGKGKDPAEQTRLDSFLNHEQEEQEKNNIEQGEERARLEDMRNDEERKRDSKVQNHQSSSGTASTTSSSAIVSTADSNDIKNVHIKHTPDLQAKKEAELVHFHAQKDKGGFDMHFMHIPKCGGTSMSGILRQVACQVDENRNDDCCTNPGFCDHNAKRRCASIHGCINHVPHRPWVYKPPPSITLLREPMSRLLSAWFYRCHSPNIDCYGVRPEFKLIKKGILPKVEFHEYLDMPEYHNIQTRMLGGDSFPYRNYTVTRETFDAAVDALENMFFVGLTEAYDLSVHVLLRELQEDTDIKIVKERDNTKRKHIIQQKADILNNATAVELIKQLNSWDIELYRVATEKFCATVKIYPEFYKELQSNTSKVHCPN